MGSHRDEGWEWRFNWRRNLFDSEVSLAADFLEEIGSSSIQQQRSDSWTWKADPSGSYSTKSAYGILPQAIRGDDEDGVFGKLWKLKLPSKALVFSWRLIKDRLPTKVNLRRQVEISDSACPLCNCSEEDAAHLFFSCNKTLPLWWESLSWVKSLCALPKNPRAHFLEHSSGNAVGNKAVRWTSWWIALTRTIWHHRNKLVFENQTFNATKVMDDVLLLLWSWLKATEKDFVFHFNHWSSNLKEAFV